MLSDYTIVIPVLVTGMLLSVYLKKLTTAAAYTGSMLAVLVFMGAGFTGIAMMIIFFILGTVATSWKIKLKRQLKLAEENKGRRTAAQVIANAGAAAIAGFLAYRCLQQKSMYCLMVAAAFSAATADTLSSELGNIYGSKFYNIITFKKDKRGLDGVVSIEGSLFGIAGSIIISAIYAAGFGWSINILWIIIAGTVGNLADSVIGATAERKHLINNNLVNFLNTSISAITAAILYKFFL